MPLIWSYAGEYRQGGLRKSQELSALALGTQRLLPTKGMLFRMEGVQVGQEDYAFLFVGIGAGDDGDCVFRGARVVREMGHVRRDVEEVSGAKQDVLLELIAVPHAANSAEHVDRAFVGGVFVGFRAATRRDGEELHVDGLRTYGLGGDGWGVHQALLALVGFSGSD